MKHVLGSAPRLLAVVATLTTGVAAIKPAHAAAVVLEGTPPAATAVPSRHMVYAELGGKAGLWGLGYELSLSPRFVVGAAASYLVLDGQRIASLSPYAGAYLLGARGRHRWFVHGGPALVRVTTPSPVPEWDGTSTTGVGVEVSSGYEHRRGALSLRGFAMVAAGRGGVAPWAGMTIGFAL